MVLSAKYNQKDQCKEKEMGVACRTNGGEDKCIKDTDEKAGGDRWEDQEVEG
jgi:hypothetical protein